MAAAGGDNDTTVLLAVNDAMFAVNAAAPPAGKLAAQRLRLADAGIRLALDILD